MEERVELPVFLGFSLMDGLYWAFYAAFAGFITTYMLAEGMTGSVLSLILAAFMLCAFAGAFFWGGLSDRLKSNRKVFLGEYALTVAVAALIYFMVGKNVMLAGILYPLFGFLAAPLGSKLDAWMLKNFDGSAAIYGRARAMGSLGYAVMALAGGNLITAFGYQVILISSLILAALVMVFAFVLKEKEDCTTVRRVKPSNPKELLKVKPYMFLLVILFFTGLSISPVNNLKIVLLQSVGGDVSVLGLDSFLGVAVQAVFIFISGSLRRIPSRVRLFSMSFLVFLTMFCIIVASNPWMIIAGTVLNNVSYGLMLPTMREITEETVTGSLKNTAHAMTDAMYGSFSGVIALLYSGFLMDAFGAKSVAMLGAGIMCIPVLLSFVSMMKKKNENR